MRLILADDQPVYREGVKSLLANSEWVDIVGEADDEVALLELLECGVASAVLLDPGISGGAGIHIIERMRDLVPELRVVIITGLDDHAHVKKAIESGVEGYLLRSIDAYEIATALRMVADGHHYIQAELVNTLVDPSAASLDRLRERPSPQQLRILQLVTQGLTNKQIARGLGISETTVKSQLRVIYSRLDASSRAEAVATALRLGIVE